MPSDSRSQPPAGRSRRASPSSPAAAATAAAMIAIGSATITQPACSHGWPRFRYAVQFPAPRRNVAADMVPVVVADCST